MAVLQHERLEEYRFTNNPLASTINVGAMERWGSGVVGSALAVYGLSRGSLGGMALAAIGGAMIYRGITGHCELYKSLGIDRASVSAGHTSVPADHGVRVEETIEIARSAADIYQFWRDFDNLPKVMRHIEAVRRAGPNTYHWVAQGPLGQRIAWDAEIHMERKNELIAWRSLPGSEVDNAGSVHFRQTPNPRLTEVQVVLKYDPPAGKLGVVFSRLFGQDAEAQIREDLRSFKQYMESRQ